MLIEEDDIREKYIRIDNGISVTMLSKSHYQVVNNKVIRLDDECTVIKDIDCFIDNNIVKQEKLKKYNEWRERIARIEKLKSNKNKG